MSVISSDWNSAFVHVTKPQWNMLLRFAYSLAHARHEADDLLQTCLLKGLRGFPRFVEVNLPGVSTPEEAQRAFEREENLNHLRNWLFKILKNSFLDDCAKGKRMVGEEAFDPRTVSQDDVQGRWHGHAASAFGEEASFRGDVSVPDAEVARAEATFFKAALDDTWRTRLGTLTSRQRSVLFLAAEGYAYKEIASILDVPIGTVMSNLSRSLQKLRRADKAKEEPEGIISGDGT